MKEDKNDYEDLTMYQNNVVPEASIDVASVVTAIQTHKKQVAAEVFNRFTESLWRAKIERY